MSYASEITIHTKKRGIIRGCEWCGEKILIGEQYAKWRYADGEMVTVYAHKECAAAWRSAVLTGDFDKDEPPCGYMERPRKEELK